MAQKDDSITNGNAALRVTVANAVATVTLNRPAVHNAFDDALIATLTGALQRIGDDQRVRVVLLAAAGKSFSAGADLNWMRRMADYGREENLQDSLGLARLMQTLDCLPQPTIARVQGPALGGGLGLVACCDIAIASEAAFFALSEVRLGLTPSVISPYMVRAMGERQVRRFALTAERFDARRAFLLGLIHEVVAADKLDDRIKQVIAAMRRNGPKAMCAAKALVREVAAAPIGQDLRQRTAHHIADIRASAEGRAGVSAFLEKRKPDWVGGDD